MLDREMHQALWSTVVPAAKERDKDQGHDLSPGKGLPMAEPLQEAA